MAALREELIEQALTLPKEDRAKIAGALIRSLEPTPQAGVGEAWREEIERRAREIDNGTVQCIPAAAVEPRRLRRSSGLAAPFDHGFAP